MASDSSEAQAQARASGRVRRRPETLYDTSPGSKRRRYGDDEATDESDSDSTGDEGEPDEEELRQERRISKTKGSRQHAQKKARTSETTALPIRNVGASKKARTKKGLDLDEADAAGGIFADIFSKESDAESVVAEWLRRFESHESSALAEIINFILRVAGCTSSVTSDQIEDPDAVTTCIEDLQDEFQASNPTDYPLMAKGRKAVTVKQGVTNLIDALCKSIASNGMLFNNPELMENINAWLSTMSTAANRPFRHTAAVCSLLCATSLCDVARDLASDASKYQRQAEAEGKKASKNKARVADIQKKVDEAQSRIEVVEELIKDWFDTVFVHRYKDVDAAIRRECIAALGNWISILPSRFLDDSHLRYLSWLLNDTHFSVRQETIKQLLRFYKVSDMISGLHRFTEKCRPRLIEMATADAEVSVRTATIELLDIFRDNGLLEPDDIDSIGRLIFETDDKVRKAAARFLAAGINELYEAKIDELGGREAIEETMPAIADDDHSSLRLEWLKYKCIAETLQVYHNESDLPSNIDRSKFTGELVLNAAGVESRFSLAAHDLREQMTDIDQAQYLAGYLLADLTPSKTKRKTNDLAARLKKECVLSPREEAILLDVLYVSITHQITTLASQWRTTVSAKHKEERRDVFGDAVRWTLLILPQLLERYGDSPDTASIILRSQRALNIDAVQDLAIDAAAYDDLLEQAKRQFLSHSSHDVLSFAVQIILQATSMSELEDSAAEKLAGLWESVMASLLQSLDISKLEQRGSMSEDELQAVSDDLARIKFLSTISDCSAALEDETPLKGARDRGANKAPVDCIVSLIARAKNINRGAPALLNQLEDTVAQNAAWVGLFYLRWRFISIKNTVTGPNGVNPDDDEMEALADRRDRYADLLSAVLQSRKAKDEISMPFADLLIEFQLATASLMDIERNADVNDHYTSFHIEMHKEKQREVMRAFAGAEAVYASLTKKKLEPAPLSTRSDEPELDDFDEDPLSDDEDEDEAETQASQVKRDARLASVLLAESRLCKLTAKIVLAVLGSHMDRKPTRQRVERNKQKLSQNFREVCKYFDPKLGVKGKSRPQKRAKDTVGGAVKAVPARRDNAIDADTEEEDEIEDEEGVEV